MPCLPANEPHTVTAGDTLAWTVELPEYPASYWTLNYSLQKDSAAAILITATASGDSFLVNVTAATSANYAPGLYSSTAFVTGTAGECHTLHRSNLTILPNPRFAPVATHAAKMLHLIECALENRIPNGLEGTDIDGQRIDRIRHADLVRLRTYYVGVVQSEKNRASMASGRGNRRTAYASFLPIR